MGVVVFHIRIGNVVFPHGFRQLVIILLHAEVDDGIHILPEIRIAPGQAVEKLMGQEGRDLCVHTFRRHRGHFLQKLYQVDLRTVGISAGSFFLPHGRPDKHDRIQRRHCPAVPDKSLLHLFHAAADQFLFRVRPVQHLFRAERFVVFQGGRVVLHNISDLVGVDLLKVFLIGKHQFPAFFSRCKTVRDDR